ncbi:Acg family FMN-binding oxidoreductase [Streptomyces sp. NPDC127097]|uniref:Acg family FMN-binding oxidoreductase n=1 Tax=Streptomyces sp. NPDC127097 TaxID=3347136 RepID=UPI003666EF80
MFIQTLDDTLVKSLVADAVAAPSMHNAQPWCFSYARHSRAFTLSVDLERALPHADPTTRGMHLGCGAALLNLRVAAAHAGHRTRTTLLPDPHAPALLAVMRLDDCREPADEPLPGLHPAIHDRHTSRFPFSERQIPESVRGALTAAAAGEGARLTFLTTPHRETVLDLITHAEGYNRMDADREDEQRRWTHGTSSEEITAGIPEDAFGPVKRSGSAPTRDFAGRRTVAGRAYADFERCPQLASLSTTSDGPADWLRAGQALERVLLLATLQGLASSFATQAVEWPDLRWILRDPVSGTGHVHMILRLGYGPRGPRTPRRPVEQVLTIKP